MKWGTRAVFSKSIITHAPRQAIHCATHLPFLSTQIDFLRFNNSFYQYRHRERGHRWKSSCRSNLEPQYLIYDLLSQHVLIDSVCVLSCRLNTRLVVPMQQLRYLKFRYTTHTQLLLCRRPIRQRHHGEINPLFVYWQD
jgi:hypothetical protein